MRRIAFVCGIIFFLVSSGCERRARTKPNPKSVKLNVTFTDVTKEAGIRFVHNSGAFGARWLPETMGAGCCWLDFNNDGWQDIFLVNSRDWTEAEFLAYLQPVRTGRVPYLTEKQLKAFWQQRHTNKSYCALYLNNKNGTFTDVTKEAGLQVEMYGLGCCAADYDNDGDDDLYVTCWGKNRLFRNEGSGNPSTSSGRRFTDVTDQTGTGDPGFSASAAFFDYDNDGDLDLFVCNYVEWTPQTDIPCTLDGESKSYCTPEKYVGEPSRLYRNDGGKFKDVTKEAGVFDANGKALGVTILDFNEDGWIDFAVARDTQRNLLYENQRKGKFKEIGVESGIAYPESGRARAGMGIDAGDYGNEGREGIVIGNFSNEMLGLYHNEGDGFFLDVAPGSEVGRASQLSLVFGCFFFDFDLDSRLDILAAAGHIDPDWGKIQSDVTYEERPLLFHNEGKSEAGEVRFEEVGLKVGKDFAVPRVARGAAYADYDNDGDLDVLITENNGQAVLLRNDGGNKNHWLRVKLIGAKSNRNGIGCKIKVTTGGVTQMRMIRSGSSYCSQSELCATFGLGVKNRADVVEVYWTSGKVTKQENVKADQVLVVREE